MMLVFSQSAVPRYSSFIWVPSNMSVFSFGQLLNRLDNDFPWMLRHFASVKDSIKGQFSATMWILSSVTQSHCVQSKKRSWCFLLNMRLNSRGLIQQWRPAERKWKEDGTIFSSSNKPVFKLLNFVLFLEMTLNFLNFEINWKKKSA